MLGSVTTADKGHSASFQHSQSILYAITTCIVSSLLSFLLGWLLVGQASSKNDSVFNGSEFVGVCLLLLLFPVAIHSLMLTMQLVSQRVSTWGASRVALGFLGGLFICFAGAVFSMVFLIKPWATFEPSDGTETWKSDELQTLVGGMYFTFFVPLTIVCWYMYRNLRAGQSSVPWSRIHPDTFKDNWKAIVGLIWLFSALIVACSSFSNVWNYSSHSYFPASVGQCTLALTLILTILLAEPLLALPLGCQRTI